VWLTFWLNRAGASLVETATRSRVIPRTGASFIVTILQLQMYHGCSSSMAGNLAKKALGLCRSGFWGGEKGGCFGEAVHKIAVDDNPTGPGAIEVEPAGLQGFHNGLVATSFVSFVVNKGDRWIARADVGNPVAVGLSVGGGQGL